MRVLVIEDDWKVAEALRDGLTAESHEVVVERTGQGGLVRSTTEAFDLIVLDLSMPDKDGSEILAAVRERDSKVPVVILTARDAVQERVAGLDAGADDYLVKPFAFAELLARIRALVRRGMEVESARLSVGLLSLDPITRNVNRNGAPVELTVKEFELLRQLMRYEGQVVSRESIAREVWHEPARTTPLDNVIDVHVARLRRKVDVDDSCKLIHTIRGVGFMMHVGEP